MASRATNSKNAGFTLIEVLLTSSIIVIIAGISIYSFSSYQQKESLDGADTDLVSLIKEAQSKTVSEETSLQYGVHVTSTGAVLFSGSTYGGSASSIETITFPPSVTLSTINLATRASDIVFTRSTGETNAYGTLVLTNTSGKQATITVQETGLVSD